jgi:hypothetical protein
MCQIFRLPLSIFSPKNVSIFPQKNVSIFPQKNVSIFPQKIYIAILHFHSFFIN